MSSVRNSPSFSQRHLATVLFSMCLLSFGSVFAQRAGDTFPSFVLRDAHHELVSSSDLQGEVWIINFWASWCLPCRSELPLLARVAEELETQDVNLLLINAMETATQATTFLESEGLTLRTLVDPDHPEPELESTTQLLRRLRSRGLPTTYFVDSDFTIRSIYVGELNNNIVAEHLAGLGLSWRP